jgi:hypothetical protein
VDRVKCELLSPVKFPGNREKYREIKNIEPFSSLDVVRKLLIIGRLWAYSWIVTSKLNREFKSSYQGRILGEQGN